MMSSCVEQICCSVNGLWAVGAGDCCYSNIGRKEKSNPETQKKQRKIDPISDPMVLDTLVNLPLLPRFLRHWLLVELFGMPPQQSEEETNTHTHTYIHTQTHKSK